MDLLIKQEDGVQSEPSNNERAVVDPLCLTSDNRGATKSKIFNSSVHQMKSESTDYEWATYDGTKEVKVKLEPLAFEEVDVKGEEFCETDECETKTLVTGAAEPKIFSSSAQQMKSEATYQESATDDDTKDFNVKLEALTPEELDIKDEEFCEPKNYETKTLVTGSSFVCEICKETFSTKAYLKQHLKTHVGEKAFKCQMHMSHIATHSGEKPFKCNECDYGCYRKTHLDQHMSTHTSERPFQCNQCDYKCSRSGRLRQHIITHTGKKPFQCNVCNYQCLIKANLRRHMTKHTGEKPFECNACDYKCSDKSALRRHKATHTGEKPFQCNLCDYKCSRKSDLRRHITKHTGEKPFKCNVCDYQSSEKSKLRRHNITRHTGEKPL